MLTHFRRHQFRIREEFAAYFRRISTYDRVVPCLAELVSRTLLRLRAGGYELRCLSALEARALETRSPTAWSPTRSVSPAP